MVGELGVHAAGAAAAWLPVGKAAVAGRPGPGHLRARPPHLSSRSLCSFWGAFHFWQRVLQGVFAEGLCWAEGSARCVCWRALGSRGLCKGCVLKGFVGQRAQHGVFPGGLCWAEGFTMLAPRGPHSDTAPCPSRSTSFLHPWSRKRIQSLGPQYQMKGCEGLLSWTEARELFCSLVAECHCAACHSACHRVKVDRGSVARPPTRAAGPQAARSHSHTHALPFTSLPRQDCHRPSPPRTLNPSAGRGARPGAHVSAVSPPSSSRLFHLHALVFPVLLLALSLVYTYPPQPCCKPTSVPQIARRLRCGSWCTSTSNTYSLPAFLPSSCHTDHLASSLSTCLQPKSHFATPQTARRPQR